MPSRATVKVLRVTAFSIICVVDVAFAASELREALDEFTDERKLSVTVYEDTSAPQWLMFTCDPNGIGVGFVPPGSTSRGFGTVAEITLRFDAAPAREIPALWLGRFAQVLPLDVLDEDDLGLAAESAPPELRETADTLVALSKAQVDTTGLLDDAIASERLIFKIDDGATVRLDLRAARNDLAEFKKRCESFPSGTNDGTPSLKDARE